MPAGKYKVGDILFEQPITKLGEPWTARVASDEYFGGQMWEECRCGNEPVYQPSMKCEDCINKACGQDTQVCYAYIKD